MSSFSDQNDQELAYHKQQQLEFKLASFELKPLHILYLLAIHQGDFDNRVHRGHFAAHAVFGQRIRELMDMGLVKYDGQHCITPRGAAHVDQLCALKVKP